MEQLASLRSLFKFHSGRVIALGRVMLAITLFLIIAIAVAGAYAFLKLGRAEDPSFTIKVLTVTAAWPGATA